jgi:hypothetical protein
VHPDDLKNPQFRKGRYRPVQPGKREPVRRPAATEAERRTQFAVQTARAEFGRFYWNSGLARRMERELKKSRQLLKEAKQTRRRKTNGSGA